MLYEVTVRRQFIEYDEAVIRVKAKTQEQAEEKACKKADAGKEIGWEWTKTEEWETGDAYATKCEEISDPVPVEEKTDA